MKVQDLNPTFCPRNKTAKLPTDTEAKVRFMLGFQFKVEGVDIRSFGGELHGNIYMTRGDDEVDVDFHTGKAIDRASRKEVFNIVEG